MRMFLKSINKKRVFLGSSHEDLEDNKTFSSTCCLLLQKVKTLRACLGKWRGSVGCDWLKPAVTWPLSAECLN